MRRGAAIEVIEASASEIYEMSSPQERSFELCALMDLRLAFGPGTRLWALRSREELCYDWLYFKGSQADASFRDFALRLYAHEKENALDSMSMREIGRRIAAVFRAYRIKKGRRPRSLVPPQPRLERGQTKAINGIHRPLVSGTEFLISSISHSDSA
jgi:hypothetical protein